MNLDDNLVGQTDNAFAVVLYGLVGGADAIGTACVLDTRVPVLNYEDVIAVALFYLYCAVLGERIFSKELPVHRDGDKITFRAEQNKAQCGDSG